MIKAIETRYKGYRFRSRLEARWAVFFDSIGMEWVYEPEGFDLGPLGLYLPDFFVHGNGHRGPYIEIKPTRPNENEIHKLISVCDDKCAYGLMLWGVPGEEGFLDIHKDGFIERDSADDEIDLAEALVRYSYTRWLSHSDYLSACGRARAARFEHGERP
jgi:hypothetical protein